MSEILRVALGSIAANPFRAVLTMLGVVIGVGSVITMLALGRGAQRAVDEQLAALGANVITVTTGMRFAQGIARDQQVLTIDDAQALADHGGTLLAVVPEQSSRQQVKLGNRNLNLSVIGTTPQHAEVNGYHLQAGRLLADDDGRARRRVAVIGGEVALQLRQAAADLVGRTLLIKAMPFEIVGVYAMKGAVGFGNPDDDVYIPIETSRYRVTGDDRVQTIAVEWSADRARAGDGHGRARAATVHRCHQGATTTSRSSIASSFSPRSKRRRRSSALCSPGSPVSACWSVASAS